MTFQLLTANDLRTGEVVFLNQDEEWSTSLNSVRLADDLISAAQLTDIGHQAVANQRVVNPELIEVSTESGFPMPTRLREQLRILGPSIKQELRKPVFSGAFG